MDIRKLLATAMVIMLTLAGCSKDDPEKKPEIKVPVPTITLPTHDVGSASATFTITAAWTLSLSDTKAVPGWFTIDKTSGGAGTHTLTISITEANPSTTETRTGYIKIVSGDVTQMIMLTQPKAAVIAVTGVSLNKDATSIVVNGKESLVATVNPTNATNKNVTWSSDEESVATVSSTGEVTGVKAGTVTITVKTEDGGKTATCAVTVTATAVTVTSIALNKTTTSLLVGETETLTATIAPANVTNQNISWTSSNPAVATVTTGGVVTAVAAGAATITVTTTDGGKTATCAVTVSNPVVGVTGVSLNKSNTSLLVGATETLTAIVNPSDATNKKVTWSSSNIAVATVSPSGVVTAKGAGSATITVTTTDGGKTATCIVTVQTIPVTDVELNKTTATLSMGKTGTLFAIISPEDATDESVSWSSSDDTTVSVSATGEVKGLKPGKATITVTTTDGNKTATCEITVIDNINAGSLIVDSWGNTVDLGGGEAEK